MNFKNMTGGNDGGGRPPSVNLPSLARQPSVYSLTFDEIQNTLGGAGKDFGSMNMDDFLKSIWTAEETQAMAAAFGTVDGEAASVVGGMPLQRQGSLTLPRTLSQKTVDEVWRDVFREGGGKDGNANLGANLQQRQQTRGEITLEEFLVRAGVVREDIQQTPAVRLNDSGFYGELPRSNNNAGLGLVFQQPGRSNGIVGNRGPENYHQIPPNQSPNLAMNANGIRTSQHQLFQKQSNPGYASSIQVGNNVESGNQGMRSGIMGLSGPTVNNGFVQSGGGGGAQGGGGMGMVGLGAGGVTVVMESPGNQLSSDGLGKGNGDTSSLSPVPYAFNGGIRARKCSGAVEKVVERRQRRMIKNRESAARSRARKQAYTMELEAEVAKLKEENNELQKKQAQIMEMQKNQPSRRVQFQHGPLQSDDTWGLLLDPGCFSSTHQVLEMINQQCGPKKRCLRRTLTGPW
ncbi:bZIP transcription factor 46 isoform X2 [Magnolia sinica]|uniref:bZIP transcription factor 46 isoform X2 n=1 Tax=Magnolia sinica TaxID=86752 RepID=UPI00265954B0|nr:bZIP transcription factor 46 isoform X2 [Magnolia sinica]